MTRSSAGSKACTTFSISERGDGWHVAQQHDRAFAIRRHRANPGAQGRAETAREIVILHKSDLRLADRLYNFLAHRGGLMPRHHDHRIKTRNSRGLHRVCHHWLAMDRQDQLVAAHAAGGAGRQHDAGDARRARMRPPLLHQIGKNGDGDFSGGAGAHRKADRPMDFAKLWSA